ncbi:MAG: tRNA uridine-5-carboxymethylaminomethyl(34) synthesis GTPase MnmE [Alphaproteobacteria bacterium]
MNNDTIFALSSGFGKSGVAVIRISGDNLQEFFCTISGRKNPGARTAYFTNLRDDAGDLIDQCIVIYFAAPASFTGQDIIEIHSHGATAVINKIFDFLSRHNMRMATPGEFSRRAFMNGKMDLADIDGLAALLDAQTERQRQFALKSMLGGDGKIYAAWREQMIEIAAYAAAVLDYDENDLPSNINKKILAQTRELHNEIKTTLSRYNVSRAITHGFNIALCGETNVGKSSLFNKLVGSNRAIVSDIAGTTRDVISAQIDLDGFLVNLSDTAGIRDTGDKIEKMGIDKTKSEIDSADLVLHVFADDNVATPTDKEIIVINKSDEIKTRNNKNAIYTSVKTGDGIDELLNTIRKKMHSILDGAENNLVINARTHKLLSDTEHELNSALTTFDGNYDIFAEHVRRAADNIGKILGTITATDVMDATFSQLCLGK